MMDKRQLGVLLGATVLILLAARGDLWLDEIWSVAIARNAPVITDIVFQNHHDNNHVLNTLYLYMVRDSPILLVYRLMAIVSGIGSIFLVGHIARNRWSQREALVSMVLLTTSYPLLLYFSEARGYAPAIFFALVAYAVLPVHQKQTTLQGILGFSLVSILGILSHSTFVMVSLALFGASVGYALHSPTNFRENIQLIVAYHGIPWAFIALWYGFYIKNMEIGGGPIYPRWNVIAEASSLLIGLPDSSSFYPLALVLVWILIALGLVKLCQQGDSQWIFFLMILFIAPAAMLIISNPIYLYFRYFILCFPFFYLLLAYLGCQYFQAWGHSCRWLTVVLLTLSIVGQMQKISPLLVLGRGNYSGALTDIATQISSGGTTIGSDHDFQNRMLFDFYAPMIPQGDRLRYLEESQWAKQSPDWLIVHSSDLSVQVPEQVTVPGLGKYHFIQKYPFSGISGWTWFLFRRDNP